MQWQTKTMLAGFLMFAIASGHAATPAEQKLALASDGKAVATIVIAETATRSAQFAAAELRHHIQKITGAELPIVNDTAAAVGTRILVGESAATRALGLRNSDFKHQEYLIRFLPDTLVLMGRDKANEKEEGETVVFASGYHVLMGKTDLRKHRELNHLSQLTMEVKAAGTSDARLGFLMLLYDKNDRKVGRKQIFWGRKLVGEFQTYTADFALDIEPDDFPSVDSVRLYAYRSNQKGTIRLQPVSLSYQAHPGKTGATHSLLSPSGFDYAHVSKFPGRHDDQATCYAVYDFLERFCGVRWYLPTDVGLVCPKKRTLSVKGADVRRAPAMKYRAIHRAADMPATLTDIAGPLLPLRERMLFLSRQRLTGIEPYACNHAFYGYYKRHLRDRPEWFARGYDDEMPDGMRNQPVTGYHHDSFPMKYYPNMCYTNEEFIRQVVGRARSYFDTSRKEGGENAAGDFFSLGPMDSTGQDKFCTCPECQALLHKKPPCDAWRKHWFFWDDKASDYVFGFVNRVAREVGKTHPDKYLSIFAYHQNYYPPTREALEPNVAISFCMHAQLRAVPAMDRAVTGLLDKWDEAGERPKYLWLYFHRPGRANPFFPGFMAHQMVRQMQDYHRRGFRGIFAEPAYFPRTVREGRHNAARAPIVNMVELYVAYKLADDPTLDGDKLIDEFFARYYGQAGKAMQALYERIEHVYCDLANYAFNPETYVGYQTEEIAWGKLGTQQRMAEFGELMADARQAAGTEMEKIRVALFEESVWKRMQDASNAYQAKSTLKKTSLKSVRAPRVAGVAPNGDLDNVDWSQAGMLDGWGDLAGRPTKRRIEGRVLHDGRFLYVRLREMIDPTTLLRKNGGIWDEDDWELFVSRERGKSYRQIGVNAAGAFQCLAWGEAEREWDSGAKVVSDTSAPDRWDVRLALPLESLAPGGIRPGQTLYMNIARGTKGDPEQSLIWIPTFTRGFHSLTQMGGITLGDTASVNIEERHEGE